jgi:hypothetical protein
MSLGERVRAFGAAIVATKTQAASFIGLGIWIAFLLLGKPSLSMIIYCMPFGIALTAMGPLELIPAHWYRINYLVNALCTGAFFVSIMFVVVAVSYDLQLSKDGRLIFLLTGWGVQWIAFELAIPFMKRSSFYRLSENRGAYSPPENRER